jgi:hypothetical protein
MRLMLQPFRIKAFVNAPQFRVSQPRETLISLLLTTNL